MRWQFLLLLLVSLCACGQPSQATVRAFQTPGIPTAPQHSNLPLVAQPTATPSAPTATSTPIPPTATPPPPQPWRFVVFGDTRTAGMDPPDVLFELVAHAQSATPELTLAVGDLIKAEPDPALVAEQWRRWQAAMAPLGLSATATPWLLVTPGNHDVEGGPWADAAMAAAFPDLPSNGPVGLERRTYRYDYRGVRFISITSERYADPHRIGDQLEWLEQQLQQNPNRYTIVFSHDPAFPVGPHVGSALDAYPADRDRFWALLQQYQVTAYIAGHEHLYNRQIIAGVPQLIIGVSGSFPYIGYGGDFYHYLLVEVGNDQLTCVVYDRFGIEQDRFFLPAQP